MTYCPEPPGHPFRPWWLQQIINERLNDEANETRRNT